MMSDNPQQPESLPQKTIRFLATRSTPQLAIAGIVLGIPFGFLAKELNTNADINLLIAYPGKIFINMLKAVVMVFIIITMTRVPMDMQEVSEIKAIGGLTIVYSVATSVFASFMSLGVTHLILLADPGSTDCVLKSTGVGTGAIDDDVNILQSFLRIGENGFAPNVVGAITQNNILGVLVAFLSFGFVLSKYRNTRGGENIKTSLDVVYNVVVDLINYIIKLTPVGVFSLMASAMAELTDYCVFNQLLVFIACFLASVSIQIFFFYPLLFFIVVRTNPFKYAKYFLSAFTTAFATSSSAAALPLGIEAAKNYGVKSSVVDFVMPLGATMNMDGGSLFYPAAIMFIARLDGKTFNFGSQVALCFVSALVTIGVAPVPSGTVVFLYLVSRAIGLQMRQEIVSLIWALDPFMDRCITMVNSMGVAYGAKIVEVLSDKVLKTTDSQEKCKVKKIPKVQSNSFISKPGSLKHI